MEQVEIYFLVTLIAFFASFIGTIFILLGNDEDNDQFRKLWRIEFSSII